MKTQCGTILGVGWELNPNLYIWKHAHSPPGPQCSRTLLWLKYFPLHYFNIKVLLVFTGVSFTTSFRGGIYLFFCTKIIHFHVQISCSFVKTGVKSSLTLLSVFEHLWSKDYGVWVCVRWCMCVCISEKPSINIYVTDSRFCQNTAVATSAVNTSIQTHTRHNYENKGPSGSCLGLGGTSGEGFVALVTASKVLSLNNLTAYTVGH